MIKISVILPVYNASKYLLESLKSISCQTFKDFEIIAINDGSTDNSLELLEEYAKKEPRLLIISRENRGITKSLNEGIDLAKGEYIARMDSDDICLPLRFEKQLEYLVKNDLDVCGTQYEKFGTKSGLSNLPLKLEDINNYLLINSPLCHPSILIKKSVIKKYKYDENIKYAQDYELWCRMALDKIKMGNMSEVLLRYRFCNKSITTSKNKEQKIFALQIANNYWLKLAISKDIPFPLAVIDTYNNDISHIKQSIKSLFLLQKRLKNSYYMVNMINSEIRVLYVRLSIFGLKNILIFLKKDSNLNLKSKFIYSFIALSRLMLIKDSLKKIIPNKFKTKICNFLYGK